MVACILSNTILFHGQGVRVYHVDTTRVMMPNQSQYLGGVGDSVQEFGKLFRVYVFARVEDDETPAYRAVASHLCRLHLHA
ncbi:MAG TPA: hypothetical protein VFA18_08870 [Gemmataceae bacterium]|nr:hypothetical protein [Gemmataceae bacterium]